MNKMLRFGLIPVLLLLTGIWILFASSGANIASLITPIIVGAILDYTFATALTFKFEKPSKR